MKNRYHFVFSFLFLICHLSFIVCVAQNPDIKRTTHWYFGNGTGLDFSSGTAVADTTGKSDGNEQSFAMSDTCGNLLFYGSPDINDYYLIIRDKNHQVMPNGMLISCCNPTQCACVQQPGNDSIYYIFYNHQGGSVNGKFNYAIVNINANGGLGDVISKDNVLFGSMATEKVAITQHCNGTDFWVASKQSSQGSPIPIANQLYVWQLTQTGLNPTPVISAPGNIGWENGDGCFRFSNDGTMAAVAYIYQASLYYADSSYFEIYQFDNCTGIFSNPITIQYPQPFGMVFSPDNTKLYVGVADLSAVSGIDTSYFSQYDLTTYNQSIIIASKTVLDQGMIWKTPQLGLDGKIYITGYDTSLVGYGLKTLDVVNNPNASGLACNYVKEQIDLLGKYDGAGFCYFPDSYFSNFSYTNCTTEIIETTIDETIQVYPNPFGDFITINYTEPYHLKIIDIMGKLIYQHTITSEYYQLNTSQFKSGIYILNTSSKNKLNINHKMIKL